MSKCLNCNKETTKPKFCSYKCRCDIAYENKICPICKLEFRTKKRLNKKHCSRKCLFVDPDYLKLIGEKRKLFYRKNYNVDYLFQLDSFKDNVKNINLNKYGVEFFTQTNEMKEKSKQTCLEKYGVENALQNDTIKQKQQNTNLKKYGYDVASKNKKVRNKMSKTMKNTLQNDKSILINRSISRKKNFYDTFTNERLKNKCLPFFTQEEYLGVYNNDDWRTKYPFKCLECNNNFEGYLSNGWVPRCPICYPFLKSKVEAEILDFLKSILPNEKIIHNDRTQITPLEIDIYIPSKQFAIEYDSFHWHSEFTGNKNKKYHINKTLNAKKMGIRLVHIFEDEWAFKKEIVKNKLYHLLKVKKPNITNNNKFFDTGVEMDDKAIFGRKCIIKEIDIKTATRFIQKHHIQGYGNCSIRLGAYYNGELVAVMSFGNRRIAMGIKNKNICKNEYELIRFCVGDKNVVGIAGKLFNHFINSYKPEKITSYADRRWSDETSFYGKIGFKLISLTAPNYFYFKQQDIIDNPFGWKKLHRFNFRKDVLHKKLQIFDPNLTEWQNMQLNGYDRIWDCGHLKYEWLTLNL